MKVLILQDLTFSSEMSSGSSSNLGFGKSGNNVPVLELSEYFRIENEPCVKINKKSAVVNDTIEKRKRRREKKRNVNTRDKIHRSTSVKPRPCRVRNVSTKLWMQMNI